MISKIKIKNFKCFRDVALNISNLTVLSGANSGGKSSIIQSLLCMRQLGRCKSNPKVLRLNDSYLSLGSALDVLNYSESDQNRIKFGVTFNNQTEWYWNLDIPKESSSFQVKTLQVAKKCERKNDVKESLFGDSFEYLGADRASPKLYYQSSHEYSEHPFLGRDGSFSAKYLTENFVKHVKNNGLIRHQDQTSLLQVVESWMMEVDSNIRISPHGVEGIDDIAYFRFGPNGRTLPQNVGFGVLNSLPVVLALAKADVNDLLIIENPEVHLRPQAQLALGRMISIAANFGVQVILETHSDHIINGIRIAVKDKAISSASVSFLFFSPVKEENGKVFPPKIDEIKVNEDGSLSCWPEGFFDTWEEAILEIARGMLLNE